MGYSSMRSVDLRTYVDHFHVYRGRTLQSAWRHLFGHTLPLFDRSIVGWSRLGQDGVGHGICEERWAANLRVQQMHSFSICPPVVSGTVLLWRVVRLAYRSQAQVFIFCVTQEQPRTFTPIGGI